MMRIADVSRQITLGAFEEALQETLNPSLVADDVEEAMREMTDAERTETKIVGGLVQGAVEQRIADLTSMLIHQAAFPNP